MPRLGGAVQSFRGRRGCTQAPPLANVSTATADKRSMGAGLNKEEEAWRHSRKALWLDDGEKKGEESEKYHWPVARSKECDWLLVHPVRNDWTRSKACWEEEEDLEGEKRRNDISYEYWWLSLSSYWSLYRLPGRETSQDQRDTPLQRKTDTDWLISVLVTVMSRL